MFARPISTTFFFLVCLWAGLGGAAAANYDPLQAVSQSSQPLELTVTDQSHSREIPLRIYLPQDTDPAAVILFSHGLGGTNRSSPYLGRHWAARGYVVVYMQHHGSDDAVWRGRGYNGGMAAMKKAASGENLALRVQDVHAVLDQLQSWNATAGNPLYGRLDMSRVGMSGHSFGAVTTQSVSGQIFPGKGHWTDERIKAAIMFSPRPPAMGSASVAFGSVKIPWMLMTGTLDNAPIGGTSPEQRRNVYPALPSGSKYELVLYGAKHSAFTERPDGRNPNHHRVVLALSTAFWDAYLLDSDEASTWLDGDGPSSVLQAQDLWQHK